MRAPALLAGALALAAALPAAASAQSLADRIARLGADQAASFSFAAREGTCGGPHFVRHGNTVHVSRGSYSFSGDTESHPCAPGPVRVTLLRAGGQVVGLEVGIGADDTGRALSDLGAVAPPAAAGYLLQLARTGEGRPASAALFPAMLAEGVDNSDALLGLARDRARSRQVRQGALTWLGREAEMMPATQAATITRAVVALARDEADAPAIRQHAMSVLGRTSGSPGIPALVELARAADPWLARTATSALAGSGDPRARAHLREVVRSADRREGVRVAAIRGLGRSQATADDLALLRQVYPTLATRQEREAALAAIGEAGGAENVAWLIGVARDRSQEAAVVTRALRAAGQAGATSAQLVALYDGLSDRAPRTTVIALLGERGDQAAIDKLLSIAQGDTDVALRRAAIQRLGNSSDPRVREALAGLVGRGSEK